MGNQETISPIEGVTVKASHCEICNKLCSEIGTNYVPSLCSLECKQKWYVNWDKDWAIGDGKARLEINQVRAQGYLDYKKIERVAASLGEMKEFAGRENGNSFWALLGIIRDLSVEDSAYPTSEFRKPADDALDKITTELSFINQLYAAILDKNKAVVAKALSLLKNNIQSNRHTVVNYFDYKVIALLKHEDFWIRSLAIDLLEAIYKKNGFDEIKIALVKHFKSDLVTPEEGERIFLVLDRLGDEAIPELKELQQIDWRWVRDRATLMLSELGSNPG